MFFQKTTLLALWATTLVAAIPAPTELKLPATPDNLVILEQEVVEHGILVTYGDIEIHGADGQKLKGRSLAPTAAALEKRACGTNNVVCNSRNYIPSARCSGNLINIIGSTDGSLQQAPRSICLQGSDGFCCISWANPVSGGRRANLLPAARKILSTCVENGQSGLTRNTNLSGTCTTECLSSDANSCRN